MSDTYTNNVGRSDYRLPTVSANDNGKILQVVDGEWKKAEGGGGSSLPEYGESDAGKVLSVAPGGESLEWSTPSGGGGITMLVHVTNITSVGDYKQATLDTPTSDILTHLSNGGVLIIEYNAAYYHLDFCDLSTPWDEGVTLYRTPYVLKNESTGEFYVDRIQYIGYEGSGEDGVYGNWWYTEVNRGTTSA